MTEVRSLTFTVLGTDRTLEVSGVPVVVAGYTGADPVAVQRHIDELAAIGVPPPATVPAFYPVHPSLATQDEVIAVSGGATSGEVEPVVLRLDGRLYLTVGSDHTDRDLERHSVAQSKQACPKPVSHTVIEVPADGLDWDTIEIKSTVDGELYQDGTLASLRRPTEILDSCTREVPDAGGDLIMFGGTVPLLTGTFVPGRRWTVSLEAPGAERLEHSYTVRQLPTAA